MGKIVLFNEKKQCCGCGACMIVCKKDAISMKPDEFGCIYPQIDETLCIGCKKCVSICKYGKSEKKSLRETYVAISTNTDIQKSASGGLFAALAKKVLKQGGCVVGCAMIYEREKLYPRHICISEQNELYKLLGSKYVQSDLNNIYQVVRNKLLENIPVLFSGTPCQITGLYGYLQKDYSNLFTVDIICHGVPSIQFFQDYLQFTEERISKKITDFKFRDKSKGWKLYGNMTCLSNRGTSKQRYFEPSKSSYYQMFLNGYTYRDSCYRCPYAGENRQGNITIGDFWCVELVHPELIKENGGQLHYQDGTSCLIINDEKGKIFVEQYGTGIKRWKSTYENASKYNGQLKSPSILPEERTIVLGEYKKGYGYVEKWYQKRQIPINIKIFIRRMIPSFMKQAIKYGIQWIKEVRCNER